MFVIFACLSSLFLGAATGETVERTVPGLGTITGNIRPGCYEFLGIRYATADRFEDPKDVESFPDPYDATFRRSMCYQKCPAFPEQVCQQEGGMDLITEDCLFLNIFTPKGNPSNTCVMVFIHGGNYRSYSGGSSLYDGEAFVKTGRCILVTINYRLGAFGFLGSRNTGLRDQMKALEWVNTNIEYFGGDKNKVTLFGQSAGAQSIAVLMSIPSASAHFKRAILQSCPITLPFRTAIEGAQQEAGLAALMMCPVDDLSCYQSVSADDILTFQDQVPFGPESYFLLNFESWGPTIENDLVKDNLYQIFVQNLYEPKDTILGTVADEGPIYIYSIFNMPLPEAALNVFLQTIDPSLTIEDFAPAYIVTDPSDTRDVLSKITTDYVFNCVSQDVWGMIRSKGKRAYSYEYREVFPPDAEVWGAGDRCNNLVCHGIELPVLFGSYSLGGYTLSPAQEDLSEDMIKYWSRFAKKGNPYKRRSGLARWRQNRQLLLKAGSTRMRGFFDTIFMNNPKCQQLKMALGYNPF